jgi:metal-sulfur cluster biosynthetic enzyme
MTTAQVPSVEAVRKALRDVIDPELGLDIVTLGLIYDITIGPDGALDVRMSMTSRGCPMQGVIALSTQGVLESMSGVGPVTVDVVWEPAWTPERIDPKGRAFLGL